jgi:hypothetical protein
MEALSDRLLREQIQILEEAAARKTREDHLANEDITPLLRGLQRLGIVRGGKTRALWLLYGKPYRAFDGSISGLLADLLLAVATISRISGADPVIAENGRVEFKRQDRIVASFIIVSGSGHLGRIAIEAEVERRQVRYDQGRIAVLVGGTSAQWRTAPTPPKDIVSGEESVEDILVGPTALLFFNVDELRNSPALIHQVVP